MLAFRRVPKTSSPVLVGCIPRQLQLHSLRRHRIRMRRCAKRSFEWEPKKSVLRHLLNGFWLCWKDAFHGWVQDEMSRSAERTRWMNSPTCTSRRLSNATRHVAKTVIHERKRHRSIPGGSMWSVPMIRTEPGLVSIPLEKAVYCENCKMVSSSARQRCGLCGSERIVRMAPLIPEPWNPGPMPALAMAA